VPFAIYDLCMRARFNCMHIRLMPAGHKNVPKLFSLLSRSNAKKLNNSEGMYAQERLSAQE
jgi:hypothetical protein